MEKQKRLPLILPAVQLGTGKTSRPKKESEEHHWNARSLAGRSFIDKVDKAGAPYHYHLQRVADRVHGTEMKAVAWLHDILEDCPEIDEAYLRTVFPDNIVDAVVAITRKRGQSYADFIEQVCTDPMAMQVKLADLKDNMDITRLPFITKDDIDRLKKYHKAYHRIMQRTREQVDEAVNRKD
jgi:(p)ppGpp synthase/HD superfamily hydrolase